MVQGPSEIVYTSSIYHPIPLDGNKEEEALEKTLKEHFPVRGSEQPSKDYTKAHLRTCS